MLNKYAEQSIGKLLYLGLPIISLLVTGFMNFDPVNVGKMVIASGVGFALLILAIKYGRTLLIRDYKMVTVALIWFSVAGLVTSLFSEAPFVQNLYGVFGRNTGLLTYISLAGILFGALMISNQDHFRKIVQGLLIAGTLNVVFCALELMGTNIFGFNNIYGEILGTFGNPNFISSFLGIFVSVLLAYVVLGRFSLWTKALSLAIAESAGFSIAGGGDTGGDVGFIGRQKLRNGSGSDAAFFVSMAITAVFCYNRELNLAGAGVTAAQDRGRLASEWPGIKDTDDQ